MRFIDLNEGPNDPGIFKAVFLAGGPGSGKSYVAQQLALQARGLKVLNSDDAFEYLMRKRDLSFEMPPEQQPERDAARQLAKTITKKKQDIYLDGRLGLIIDGTAKDPAKMAKLKTELEAIGYQTMMVFVNTSLRTALQRNLLRPRKVPSDIVAQSHKLVQANKEQLADVFAPNFVEIDNNENPDFNTPLKRVDRFIDSPITAQARDWVSKAQLQKTVTQEDVSSKPKVYVDMDGVIANFYAGVTAATGHEEPRAMALQDIEDTMASFAGTDFFFKLPKYDQADQLIAMVNNMTGGDWYILSSPLKYDREGSAKHKAAWVKKYLNIQPKGMHFTGDKAKFATQPDGTPNILIDDYPKYLNSWKDAGGIGVQYKGHAGNISDVKATLDKHLGDDVDETIRKVKGGYRLLSKKGKNLGTYPTKSGAENREREVQYFKHNESLEENVSFVKPQFDVEWEEATRYDFLDKLGQQGWEELAKTGKAVTVTKNNVKKIGNTGADGSETLDDLEPDKVARLKTAMKSGTVEMPIVMKQPNGELELIAGNTRLIGLINTVGKATVWYIDASKLEENFADGKVKGKSRPGRVKRAGASCAGSVTDLRKRAKNASGEKAKMYHWCANMKSGKRT